ncbi:hypothetical protein EVAR_100738_1 [Eumeta japonica]|uniref:Uncharacterized protein n=1 Tax=Eumeta variegata TaxID=151549 RepID=A0A4C1ZX49_EUMVA|nr:hypothetical protein EVAR_100738_1 [Eumeta japonica]
MNLLKIIVCLKRNGECRFAPIVINGGHHCMGYYESVTSPPLATPPPASIKRIGPLGGGCPPARRPPPQPPAIRSTDLAFFHNNIGEKSAQKSRQTVAPLIPTRGDEAFVRVPFLHSTRRVGLKFKLNNNYH